MYLMWEGVGVWGSWFSQTLRSRPLQSSQFTLRKGIKMPGLVYNYTWCVRVLELGEAGSPKPSELTGV